MKFRLFFRFARYLKPYWGKETVLLLMMILSSVGTLASPYVLKIIIDTVFPSHDFVLLLEILFILLGINILRLVIGYFSDYLFEWVSNHITRDIRMDLFRHLMQLPVSFFDKNKAGDLVHRVDSEVNSIRSILTGTVVRLINSVCTIVGLAIMLCILNRQLFLVSMAVMPFIFLNTRRFQPKIQQTIKQSREKDADILSFLMERFANIKLIKSYVHQNLEQKNLLRHIREQIGLNLKNVRLRATTQNITMLFTMMVPLLILGMGGKSVMAGAMTVGALVAFIQYMNRIFDPFRNLMGLYFDAIRAAVSMQRIFDLMEIKPEDSDGAVTDIQMKQDIIFRNVHFKYDNTTVLNGLDFTFRYGKKYALAGGSGCGKSTLTALLCRFYHPQEGVIRIGDTDIRQINIHALRQRIAWVSQDNQLFHDSIEANIRYGRPDGLPDELVEAACQAGIAPHIESLPEKFNTRIGDRGAGLSGGQQQRMAIARAILKNADIIILDEATAALDSDSERNILEALCALYADKTMIIISHRLSTIRNVDEIVCLDKGTIVESGSHETLLQKKGFYFQLFKEQMD
ncbi:MAG: ABC transporter ATP-binding protein/permease [Odoribacteraceae bacterium]|jgi:ABC-type multidrug transport system fused ATPase/permease subunit|nr:ABC transporter ATP-binding protein/permease [Odoribacteraceae bacterium]